MKMFVASLVFILSSMLLFDSISCLAIPAPEGYIWTTNDGSTFKNGASTVTPTEEGLSIYCDDANRCCWEITDGGKNLEIYTVSLPPKDGPIGPSTTLVTTVPEIDP